MPNTIFQNLFFKIITSLANIFSNLFSPREILGFFFISIQLFILFIKDGNEYSNIRISNEYSNAIPNSNIRIFHVHIFHSSFSRVFA